MALLVVVDEGSGSGAGAGSGVGVGGQARRLDAFDCPSITYVSGSSSFADHAPTPEGSLGLPSAYIGEAL